MTDKSDALIQEDSQVTRRSGLTGAERTEIQVKTPTTRGVSVISAASWPQGTNMVELLR